MNRSLRLLGLLLLVGFVPLGCAGAWRPALFTSARPGLAVQDGKFMHAGAEFHGIGINFMSAFSRVLDSATKHPAGPYDLSYREGFATLRQYDIPFIRFNANGYWPIEWKLYRENKELYFKLLDDFVREAEKQHLGLIPSFFWRYSTTPDLLREPLDQWGNPRSKTIAFMRQYTREFVERYKHSPAIWGYEFGNEYMLEADLPNFKELIAPLVEGISEQPLGLPKVRTDRDKIERNAIRQAYAGFATTIRQSDPSRPIITGDAMPRSCSWHLHHEASWQADSIAQWGEIFVGDCPDPVDTLNAHVYYWDPQPRHDYGPAGQSPLQAMQIMQRLAAQSKKPLFVGEFGYQDKLEDVASRQRQFDVILNAILECHVQLAAAWVFDFPQQPHNNITPQTENAFVLERLAAANRQLRARP
jgi:hypothetical protein